MAGTSGNGYRRRRPHASANPLLPTDWSPEAPPWTAHRGKPPLKLSGIGMLLGTSQPVYTCSAPWCALLLPALLTSPPVSTCLPRKRESRCKYPMIRVSGQQESSSVGVLSGNSLGRFCTPPANPRSSKLWGRLLSIYTLTLWFQAKVLSLQVPSALWGRGYSQAVHLWVWLPPPRMQSTTSPRPRVSHSYCSTFMFLLFAFWHLKDLVPVLGEWTIYGISFLFSLYSNTIYETNPQTR